MEVAEEIRDRNAEDFGNFRQAGGADAVATMLVFLELTTERSYRSPRQICRPLPSVEKVRFRPPHSLGTQQYLIIDEHLGFKWRSASSGGGIGRGKRLLSLLQQAPGDRGDDSTYPAPLSYAHALDKQ